MSNKRTELENELVTIMYKQENAIETLVGRLSSLVTTKQLAVLVNNEKETQEIKLLVLGQIDTWAKNKKGNHTCVDCECELKPKEVVGNKTWGDPRCEECYDHHKYGA